MKLKKMAPVTRHLVTPIINLWIKEINGLENLPKKQPFIIAPNHCSYIDHFLIGSTVIPYLNRKVCYIAKKEHFDSVHQNVWHRLWSEYVPTIPIDRKKGKEALNEAVSYLKKGEIILIYPEGTRSLTGKIQKGRTGVARMVLLSHVPIVPLGIIGTFQILPKGKKLPRMKKAKLKFGKPMYFNKYYNKQVTKKLLREITDKIMKEIAKLSGQKYKF